MAIDLDAILAEDDIVITEVVLRKKTWHFRQFRDVPLSLYTGEIADSQQELERLALVLSNAVDPKERKDFAALELTVREAQALWDAIVANQQGLTPGESEASPEPS